MTRSLKAGVLALGVLGLLVLVAMAARGGHPGTSGDVATRPVPNTLQDSLITLLAIVYVAVLVAIVVALFRYRGRWHEPQSRWLANFALVTVVMLIATGIGYVAITHHNSGASKAKNQRAQGAPGTTRPRGSRVRPVPVRQAHFEWPLALGIGGLVLLGGVWVYVRNRRRFAPLLEDQSLQEDMVSAIETSIDDLRSERDARRAVIATYALMERTLARHGLARHRSEAPREYLANILRGLRVRESAVLTLTNLFEYAKFSPHEIDGAMKEEAIDALIAIRDDLQREEELAA